MKNYDEVTKNLVMRRDQYIAEKKLKSKRILRVSSLCCIGLVVLVGVGVWKRGLLDMTLPSALEESVSKGNSDDVDRNMEQNIENKMEQTQQNQNIQTQSAEDQDSQVHNDSTSKQLFVINEITGTVNAALKYRDPDLHYKETWDLIMAAEYLGVDVVEAMRVLPDGLGMQYVGNKEFSITYENNGTLVEDRMCYEFAGNDDAKITILASRLRTPYDCLYQADTENRTPLGLPKTNETLWLLVYAQDKSESAMDYEFYVIDFQYGGIYYRILAENIPSYRLDTLIRELVR